jgi:hypothetical protein
MSDNEGGDDGGYLEEETVDDSQLKLPTVQWAEGSEVGNMEDNEQELFK